MVGLSTATFFGKSLTENSIKLASECGADTLEIFLTTFSEYEPSYGDILAEAVKKNNISVHSMHTLNSQFEPQLYIDAERTFKDAFKFYENVLKIGEKVGAKNYTFHGPGRHKRFDEPRIDYEKMAKKTKILYDKGLEYGIELSQENVHWCYYNYIGYFKGISKYCDLKGTLDIKQAFQSGINYIEYVKEMGSKISTVHLCDYDENGKLYPLGKGIFNFKELITVLDDYGVKAPLIVELYSGDYKDISEVKHSIDYMKSLEK